MKTLITIFVLFGICLSFENIYGAEQTIHIPYKYRTYPRIVGRTESEVVQLSPNCIMDKTLEGMYCSFAWTRISLPFKKLPSDEELREFLKKYMKYDEMSERCKKILAEKGNIAEQPRESKSDTPLTKEVNEQFRRWDTVVCEDPSEEKMLTALKELAELDMRTCEVSTYADHTPLHFKKIGPYKWMSIQGPSGPCKDFVTYTIDDDPDGWNDWTYTEVRFYPSQDKPGCTLINPPEPLILRYRDKIEMECPFVKFW